MSPRISVLTTVFDPEQEHLAACLRSVARQEFTDWEHILVNDASTKPWVIEVLRAAEAADPRVRVVDRTENGGIVAASNDALAAATGEWVALLDHDDELDPMALGAMSAACTDEIDVAYSDHDLLRVDGIGPVTLDRLRPWLTISHGDAEQQRGRTSKQRSAE